MVVRHTRASLLLYSWTHSAASVTEALGLQPTASHERGDRVLGSHPLRAVDHSATHYRESVWAYEVADDDHGAEESGDASGTTILRRLLATVGTKREELALLRGDFETQIVWSAGSDTQEAGFLLDADLLAGLAALGCDFYGDLRLHETPQPPV